MIALCIGHSRGDGGAKSVDGTSEWHYNRRLGLEVLRLLRERGLDAMMIDRYSQTGYTRAMDYLAASLKSHGVRVAVELHFNSAEAETASGHEWLYWHASPAGRRLAQALQGLVAETFPRHRSRGLVPVRAAGERGGQFLLKTHCPAVIAEPFFGTNPQDWLLATEHRLDLARALADGLDCFLGSEL